MCRRVREFPYAPPCTNAKACTHYNRGVEDVLEPRPAHKATPQGHRLRLVEEAAGAGVLEQRGACVGAVHYAIARYLGVVEGSGLPVPGLHSIDGRLSAQPGTDLTRLVGTYLTLKLADGRAFGVTLLDA